MIDSGFQVTILAASVLNVCVRPNYCRLVSADSSTGPNQTWEIGRVSMKTRRYVGNREGKNYYGI